MEGNMQEYLTEKEAREKRLAVYTEKIQETVLNKSAETDSKNPRYLQTVRGKGYMLLTE